MVYRCCVRTCPHSNKTKMMHNLPNNPEIFQKWVQNLGRLDIEYSKRRSYRVCDAHFSNDSKFEMYKNRTNLKFGSIPTLHLPDSPETDDFIIQEICENAENDGDNQTVDQSDVYSIINLGNDSSADIIELEIENNPSSVESLEIMDNSEVIELEMELSSLKKPYFRSLKSYLIDSNCITEVCRICFRSITDQEMIKLNKETPPDDVKRIKTMLHLVLPDLDLEIYSNLTICIKCEEQLISGFNLKQTFLETEKKLQKIIENQKNTVKPEADLVIVAKAITKKEDNCKQEIEKTDSRKNEDDCRQEVEKIIDPEPLFNHEKIDKPPRKGSKLWGLGPYICEICGNQFVKLQRFKNHLFRHKKDKIKVPKQKIVCELCGQVFTSERRFQVHFQKHSETFECHLCKKIFKTNAARQVHIRQIHMRIYNYVQCHLCGKRLLHKTSLRLHLLSHNPTKYYPCHVCNKKFTLPSKLKKHLRRHTNERFECEYCGKSIKYEMCLEKHIKIYHKNEAEFVCDVCKRPYWKKSDLMKHKIRMHR